MCHQIICLLFAALANPFSASFTLPANVPNQRPAGLVGTNEYLR